MFHFRMVESSGSPMSSQLRLLAKPTHDSVFRKVFKYKECLISLLNSIYYPEATDDHIADIVFCPDVNPGVTVGNTRSTVIDVHCTTQTGSHIFVEVQLCAMAIDAMLEYFQLYSAQLLLDMWKNLPRKNYSIPSSYSRKDYSKLEPLHCLVIVDFKNEEFENTFQSDSGVHTFQMVHCHSNQLVSDFLQDYKYIYLPKIRELSLDTSVRSEWFAFLTKEEGDEVDLDHVVDANVRLAYRVASGIRDEEIRKDGQFEADPVAIKQEGKQEGMLECAKRID